MKYLITSLFLFLFILPAAAQEKTELPKDAISTYFSEFVDDPNFDAVYVSGKIFELFNDSKINIDDLDDEETKAILDVVRDVQGIRILHTDRGAQRLYEMAKKRIPTNNYELLFKVRTQDGDNIEAFIQDENAVISELFMLIGGPDTFVLLSFVGSIDLTKIAALQEVLD